MNEEREGEQRGHDDDVTCMSTPQNTVANIGVGSGKKDGAEVGEGTAAEASSHQSLD